MTELLCPRRSEIPPGPFRILEGSDHWRADRTCSFCGSLDPDLFMERVKAGDVSLIPTDKNYKVYVENDGGGRFGSPTGKFYFQHLSDAQMHEFIELLNAKRLKLREPGYFYRLPFFIQALPGSGTDPK